MADPSSWQHWFRQQAWIQRCKDLWIPVSLATAGVAAGVGFVLHVTYLIDSNPAIIRNDWATYYSAILRAGGTWLGTVVGAIAAGIAHKFYKAFLERQQRTAERQEIAGRAEMHRRLHDRLFEIDKLMIENPRILSESFRGINSRRVEVADDLALNLLYCTFTEGEAGGVQLAFDEDKARLKAFVWYMINFFSEVIVVLSPHDAFVKEKSPEAVSDDLSSHQSEIRAAFGWNVWKTYISKRMNAAPFLEVFCEDEEIYSIPFADFVRTMPNYPDARDAVLVGEEIGLKRFVIQ